MSFSPAKYSTLQLLKEFVIPKLREYSELFKWSKKQSFRMMDIGTGPGHTLQEVVSVIPKNYKEIVAADKNEDMLEFFKSFARIPRVTTKLFDVEVNPLPDDLKERFDFLFSSFCFTYVKDYRTAFSNCHQLLKNEGELFFIWGKMCEPHLIYKEMSTTEKWGPYTSEYKDWRGYFDTKNPIHTLTEELSQAHLKVLRAELDLEFAPTFKNLDTFSDILASLDFISRRIPEHDLPSYKQEYRRLTRTLFKVPKNADGDKKFSYNFPTFIVAAKKI